MAISHKHGIECQVVQALGVQPCFKYTDCCTLYTSVLKGLHVQVYCGDYRQSSTCYAHQTSTEAGLEPIITVRLLLSVLLKLVMYVTTGIHHCYTSHISLEISTIFQLALQSTYY